MQNQMSTLSSFLNPVSYTEMETEESIPNAMIRDIMVANPQSAKSEALLTTLDNRFTPMPDSMWVEILHGMDIVGAKERLEDELAGWIQRNDLYFNTLANIYLTDTLHSWAPDSLVALYLSDDRLSSRYLLVQYYMDHSHYASAYATLQNIPSEFDLTNRQELTHQHVVALTSLLPQLFADTLGYLIPDSAQTATLQQIAGDNSFFPSAWARNLLISSDLLDYTEPIVFTNNLKSSWKDKYHWKSSGASLSDFRVFPNPAKDFVIIEYQNHQPCEQALVDFIDVNVKCIKSVELKGQKNQFIIPIGDLLTGSYVIQLRVDANLIKATKLIIIR